MSTPTDTPRSPEEQAASAQKLLAEAALAKAQAREAEAKALEAELKANKAADEDAARRSKDEFHHVYRFDEQVTAGSVEKAVQKTTEWHRMSPGCDIEIIFFSPGGSVFDGFVLYDHLRYLSSQGHKIITGMQGMAASMAGILMQAGDHRWAGSESWYMIHRAAFGTMGKSYEVEDRVDHIKRVEARIVDIFVSRTNLSKQKIVKNWDRKDWWIDSTEALEYGLIDEIRGGHA